MTPKISNYLERFEYALAPLKTNTMSDIVKETRVHLSAHTEAKMFRDPVASFGPAHIYATQFHMRQHPDRITISDTFRLVGAMSVGSLRAIITVMLLCVFALTALVSLILIGGEFVAPQITGLWVQSDTGALWPGFNIRHETANAHELLGSKLILAAVASVTLCGLGFAFVLRLARKWLQRSELGLN